MNRDWNLYFFWIHNPCHLTIKHILPIKLNVPSVVLFSRYLSFFMIYVYEKVIMNNQEITAKPSKLGLSKTNFTIWWFYFNQMFENYFFRFTEQSTDKCMCILTTFIALRVHALQACTCHAKIYVFYVVNFRKYLNENECIIIK